LTYSLGTVHQLVGSGTTPISGPIGLKVALAAIPAGAGKLAGPVPEYYGLGRIVVGNGDGWHPALFLKHQAGLFYPLPDSLTSLSWILTGGVTATVTELVPAPPLNSSLAPWDRGATPQWRFTHVVQNGSIGNTTAWTFTVPTGSILLVTSARVRCRRYQAASSLGSQALFITSGAGTLCQLQMFDNAIGAMVSDEMQGGSVILTAGFALTGTYSSADVGGGVFLDIGFQGVLFNA
jgi:hypothetical protein